MQNNSKGKQHKSFKAFPSSSETHAGANSGGEGKSFRLSLAPTICPWVSEDAFPYAFKAHCKKQSCSASMKSANADPYTKFSKGG